MASPAQAGKACVSRKEYHRVERGWSKRRVHRLFDFDGHQSSHFTIGGDSYQSREYRTCTIAYGVRGFAWVDYKNGRVKSKAVVW
jgi:hypothetical protein